MTNCRKNRNWSANSHCICGLADSSRPSTVFTTVPGCAGVGIAAISATKKELELKGDSCHSSAARNRAVSNPYAYCSLGNLPKLRSL